MDLNERLMQLYEEKGVTAYEVCKSTGISEGTLSRIKNNNTKKANPNTLKALSKYFKVNYEWLATGKGEKHFRTSLTIRGQESQYQDENMKPEQTTSREAANEIERRMYQDRIDFLEEKYREALIEIGELRNKNKMRDEK